MTKAVGSPDMGEEASVTGHASYCLHAVITRAGLDQWSATKPWLIVLIGTALVGSPLLVALVGLAGEHWHPVLDLAMTEFRVRDVGSTRTPLIGLPGRILPGPDQGSHPGPLSFYLLAPVYRLLGSSSWALEAATVAIHLAAIATALWLGHRRAGWRGVSAVGALVAVVIRGYGQILLTQPWNPYLPLLAWIVVLLAAWSVLCGDSVALIPLVVAGSFCAQTHVPYLVPAGAMTIGCLVLVVVVRRRRLDRPLVISTVVGVGLWLPPVIDQAINDPGNAWKLLKHFGSPPDEPLGVSEGVRLAVRHMDVWAGFIGQFADTGRFVSPSSTWRGVVMLLIWAAAAVWSVRRGPSGLRNLHVVVAAALLLGALSMTRIFGLPWYYLTLWAWGTSAVALGAVVWTAATVWRRTDRAPGRAVAGVAVPGLGASVLVVASLLSSVSFADAEVPERRLSVAVGELAPPTFEAIADGVGAASGTDATYRVNWSDAADIGSPGFGLFDELERRGVDVVADEHRHIPATEYRVADPSEADAQIHLATGAYIERWRQVPFAVEVAAYEPRDAAELALYHQTRRRLIGRLAAEGLTDVIEQVDFNLFGGSLNPNLSAADVADFTTLLDLGQPMSVFIAPATADTF
jgi:hypothetical protein